MTESLRLVSDSGRRQLNQLTDDELMLLVSAGRKPPFAELVKRHHPLLLGYATRFLGDEASAREATQEVFVALWKERKRYKPQGRFRSYLLAIAFRRCHEAARRRCPATGGALPEAPADGDPLERLLEAERAARLKDELMQLNESTRRALLLRFFSGLSYQEISQATGQRHGTLKSQVCRGLKQLHARLTPTERLSRGEIT